MNMTRPRTRLATGTDPTAKVRAHYGASLGDLHGVRLNRHGELVGGPVGFPGKGDEHQAPQMPQDKHGRGYDATTGHGWPHDAGDGRPHFDHNHHFKEPSGLKASGKDATRSPFSRAHKDFR